MKSLASQAGFKVEAHFSDAQDYFIDALWQVQKNVAHLCVT
jgi:hypothetical protein